VQLEAACTHKGAKTHASTVFVSRDIDLWPFDPTTYGFPKPMVEHFYVKFDDPSCSGFWNISGKQTC